MIHKCESSNVTTTLRTSSKAEHIRATKTEEVDNLDDLIPGMQVDFVVDKADGDNLVMLMNFSTFFCFVDHFHWN